MNSITIGLLWHSVNSDNLGVGALTASNISIIEALCEPLDLHPKFKVFGWRDPGPVYISGDNVEPVAIRTRDLLRPSKLHAAIRECDLVIDISAGDSFADIYGTNRIVTNFLGKLAVLLAGKPLLFAPQTIGPFKSRWAHLIARFFIKRAALVTARDRLSSYFIAELKLGDKAIEATDVAMRLRYDPNAYPRSERLRVGLNVSGLLYNGGYTGKNMFELKADYKTVIQKVVGALLADESNPEVHFIGHVNSEYQPVEDDFRVARALAEEFSGTVLAPRFKNPSDAKSYISTMDFFAGARMHACIAAFSSGVPVVPMAYSRKFEGLFGTLGYDRTTDCQSETEDKIVSSIMTGYRNRLILKEEVAKAFANADSRLKVYEERISAAMLGQIG
ncbi:polysaccharide pyruvyl transferase family protein [Roseibium sp. HPY-6]|uniref:polysaccharide pyruvyl transferase family protein n=1 Tax=Roseibium sp. HPY-6 TaxID=3229852 RepID=UPI00338E6D50